MRVAAIDIGTNTILLLVADRRGEGLVPVADRSRIERLGRGVDRTGVLDEAAIARGLDALTEYAAAIRAAQVDRVGAVGTQALREARNSSAFLEPAQSLLGVPIEVIDGRREAGLAWTAVWHSFPELRSGNLVVCDVGGGSTELIVGRDREIESMISLPIGSVRMAERHLASDPPTAAETSAMIADIDAHLGRVELPRGVPLVGTAGTATTLAATSLGLEPYDPEMVHGQRLPRHEVERQLARYLELPLSARRQLRGLDERRADVMPAGAAIFARVMERMDAPEMVVSDRGIRWGLAYQLAEQSQ